MFIHCRQQQGFKWEWSVRGACGRCGGSVREQGHQILKYCAQEFKDPNFLSYIFRYSSKFYFVLLLDEWVLRITRWALWPLLVLLTYFCHYHLSVKQTQYTPTLACNIINWSLYIWYIITTTNCSRDMSEQNVEVLFHTRFVLLALLSTSGSAFSRILTSLGSS